MAGATGRSVRQRDDGSVLPEILKPPAPRAERSEDHGGEAKKNAAPKDGDNNNGRDAEISHSEQQAPRHKHQRVAVGAQSLWTP